MGTVTTDSISQNVKSILYLIAQIMLVLYLMVTLLLFGSISAKPLPKKFLIEIKEKSGDGTYSVDKDYQRPSEGGWDPKDYQGGDYEDYGYTKKKPMRFG